MKKSMQESFATYSFAPFMLSLYKSDLVKLITVTKGRFPKVDIQIGRKRLENRINELSDLEDLIKRDKFKPVEYRCFYMSVQASLATMVAANLVLEISPEYYSLYVADSADENLKDLVRDIKAIVRNRNIYRFFRNKAVTAAVFAVDFLLLGYIVLFKDMIERNLNVTIPDALFILFAALVNGMFLVPHGKNKIYLFPETQVPALTRNREMLLVGALMLGLGVTLIVVVLRVLKFI